MNQPPELFAPERPVSSDFARGAGLPYALRRLITLAVLVGLLGGGGYWLWGHISSAPGEIPTIKADGAYKQRPEQPGGIDIPHQDVQVYHEIDGSAATANTKPVIEHMLPPPEEPNLTPATVPAVPSAPPVGDASAARIENLIPPTAAIAPTSAPQPDIVAAVPTPKVVTTVSSPVINSAPPSVPSPAPTPLPALAPSPTPSPALPPVVAAPVAAVASAVAVQPVVPAVATPPASTPVVSAPVVAIGKKTVVQLAALPDKAAAETMAQKLQTKYSAMLGAARLHPVYADLGAKGVFYRIQSQPLADKQAQDICVALKKMNAGCILVRH